MLLQEKIKAAYANAKNYPALARQLSEAGIHNYCVDVSTGIVIYTTVEGETVVHEQQNAIRTVAPKCDVDAVVAGIRKNQEGKSDYPGFMQDMAAAGVRFYTAILTGTNKRCIYLGAGGSYEEIIPW